MISICGVCGKSFHGYPNSGRPLVENSVCDDCNQKYVLPLRINPHKLNLGHALAIDLLQKKAGFTREETLEMLGFTEQEVEPIENLYKKMKGQGGFRDEQ